MVDNICIETLIRLRVYQSIHKLDIKWMTNNSLFVTADFMDMMSCKLK